MTLPMPNVSGWADALATAWQPIRQNFYAVFSDGREERLVSITVLNGELLNETLVRTAKELGAVKIVIKPEEAQVKVV